MFRTFVDNGIQKHKNGYFCSLCKRNLLDHQAVLNHSSSTSLNHNKLKLAKLSKSDKDLNTLSESKLRMVVENHICQVGPSVYRCDICDCKMMRVCTVLEHIEGHRHKNNQESYRKKIFEKNNKGNPSIRNLPSNSEMSKSLQNKQDLFITGLSRQPSKLKNNDTRNDSGCSRVCNLCKVTISGDQNWNSHLLGIKHYWNQQENQKQKKAEKELCKVKIKFKTDLKAHLHSKTHLNNLKTVTTDVEKLKTRRTCKKSSPVVKEPMISKKQYKEKTHQSENLASTNSLNQFQEGWDPLCWRLQERNTSKTMESKYDKSKPAYNTPMPKTNSPNSNVHYKCNVCSLTICSDLQLLEHLHDQKHKNVKTCTKDYVPHIYCPVCKIDIFEDEKMIAHLESSDHKEKLSSFLMKSDKMKDIQINNQISEEKFILDELRREVIKIPRKQIRLEQKIVRPRFNQNYSRNFLEMGPSNLFNVDPMKLEKLNVGAALTILINNERICLVCYQKLPNNLQLLYEHLLNTNHIRKLDELVKNDFDFQHLQDQFSDLALIKEFLREVNKEVVCCFVCKVEVKNDDKLIKEHIANNENHKNQAQEQREQTQEIVKTFTEQLTNAWYIVQRLSCQLCNEKCESDIDFANHLERMVHLKKVNRLSKRDVLCYDVCIPCASMSLGVSNAYTKHCEDSMHKYLVKSNDYKVPELTEHTKNLIINAEKEAESLVLISNEAKLLEKNDLVLKSLEQAVKSDYPKAKAYIFGSTASYLAFNESDVDVFLDCGNAYNGMQLLPKNLEYLLNSQICFESQPNEWEMQEVRLKVRVPIIRVRHRELELNFNVSFMSGLMVEKTNIVKLFVTSYPLCRKMILYLKKWLKSCSLSDKQGLTTFGITWFVIFYLQHIKVLPSIAELMQNKRESRIIAGWETGICEEIPIKDCSLKFQELLRGFFEFYADYDYRSCVISPLMGKSLKKVDFTDRRIPYLPPEMQSYYHYVYSAPKPEIFRIDSPLCVQDPIDLIQNITSSVSKLLLRCFIQYCRTSAEILSSYNENSK